MKKLITIKEIKTVTKAHMDFLLFADPSEVLVNEYSVKGHCFVMEDETEQLVGIVIAVPTRAKILEIMNLSIRTECQGKGYGKDLIQHMVEYAKNQQYSAIELGTGNSSIDQIAFYQKCGFRISGVDQNFFLRHYKEKIIENGLWCRDMIRFSMQLEISE